jgi:hypothetical protein
MHFQATLMSAGKTATGFEVPPEVVEALGSTRRPPVKVTLNGRYTYRNTVAPMGGKYLLGVSAEHRAGAKVSAGDLLDVDLELDTEPREVAVPADFAAALDREPEAKRFFETLSYSHKSRHVLAIEGAKTPETRARRIEGALAMLREGKK